MNHALDAIPQGQPVRAQQIGQQQHGIGLAPVEELRAVRLGLDEPKLDAAQPHHGAEILSQFGRIRVVAARLELRHVDFALDAEQGAGLDATRGHRRLHQPIDFGTGRACHRRNCLAREKRKRDSQIEIDVGTNLGCGFAAGCQVGAHLLQQGL